MVRLAHLARAGSGMASVRSRSEFVARRAALLSLRFGPSCAFLALTSLAQAQTIPGSVAPVPGFSAPSEAPKPQIPRPVDAKPALSPNPAPAAGAAPASPYAPQPGVAQGGISGDAAPAAQPPKPKPTVKKVAPAPPRETALSTDPAPSFSAETFFTTPKALDRYSAIAAAGGWPSVAALAPGAKGKAVETLRQRLVIEGDLEAVHATGEAWDPELTEAVKRFQSRHGLKRNGTVGGATLKAMNVPVEQRVKQLEASATRLAASSFAFGERYIVVNLPSASVEAVANGVVAKRYTAVVGDVKHPSPEVEARVGAINLNPTWTVPTSIIKNEIIPKMRKDPAYLSRAKIRVLDNQGNPVDAARINWTTNQAVNYTLRQDSGTANSLGLIRIAMPNKHAVYMHDTPSKRHFALDYRFHSHGCVRVEGVYELAAWILEGVNGGKWDKDAIEQKIATGAREDIRVPKPVPVAWVYLTGWATPDGRAHFRNDVYGLDTPIGAQARAETPAPR